MSKEVTVVCKRHGRKCMLSAQANGPMTRIRHMSKEGTPVEPCDSALFIVRREFLADRQDAHVELLAVPVSEDLPQ